MTNTIDVIKELKEQGFSDKGAKHALESIYRGMDSTRRLKVIYVAGKFRSDTYWGMVQNIRKAEEVALKLWQVGWVVICPHLNTAHFQGACDDSVWLDGCLELVRRSDAVYMLKGWSFSAGANEEFDLAVDLCKETYYESYGIPTP